MKRFRERWTGGVCCACMLSCVRLFVATRLYPLGFSVRGFPRKNTGTGCHFLLQGIFPDQGSNLCLLHWQVDSLPLSHQGRPISGHNQSAKERNVGSNLHIRALSSTKPALKGGLWRIDLGYAEDQ